MSTSPKQLSELYSSFNNFTTKTKDVLESFKNVLENILNKTYTNEHNKRAEAILSGSNKAQTSAEKTQEQESENKYKR